MRIVFAGSPEVAVPALVALHQAGHEIVAVLSQPDAPTGRGRRLTPSAVSAQALELGLPLWRPEKANQVADELAALQADVGVVVAYGQLLGPKLLQSCRHGWINLHFSKLPLWRGAAPVQRAIMAGDTHTATTVFQLVAELDAGPVWACDEVEIGVLETSGQLLERMSVSGVDTILRALERIQNGESPSQQSGAQVTYAAKLSAADGQIDFGHSAQAIARQIRAVTPAPGAWTWFRGEKFKVLAAQVGGLDAGVDSLSLEPGQLCITKRMVQVGTGDGILELQQVQPAGKKAMRAADWGRGVTVDPSDRLGC